MLLLVARLHWGKFRIHYPERGRKLEASIISISGFSTSSESITPKGDGNLTYNDCRYLLLAHVQNPLPRKGTETCVAAFTVCLADWFRIHYPERGRKLVLEAFLRIPTRSESITPKGDGNPYFDCLILTWAVQNPLPRKGTETWLARNRNRNDRFRIHYPERGRKRRKSCSRVS